jgi:hypothetical protein
MSFARAFTSKTPAWRHTKRSTQQISGGDPCRESLEIFPPARMSKHPGERREKQRETAPKGVRRRERHHAEVSIQRKPGVRPKRFFMMKSYYLRQGKRPRGTFVTQIHRGNRSLLDVGTFRFVQFQPMKTTETPNAVCAVSCLRAWGESLRSSHHARIPSRQTWRTTCLAPFAWR